MIELTMEQIRYYRLHAHHLDCFYEPADLMSVTGACGLQNTPPGAWETALFNRIPAYSKAAANQLLADKHLLQAWSLRGLPLVFPSEESDIFLSALSAAEDEPWIYTKGISLALKLLEMDFDEVLALLLQVMPQLDHQIITSKAVLDETIAGWLLPLLPKAKQTIWQQPSIYGSPDKQTIGGAVVSFMLRPCAAKGLVVFGERHNQTPTFTSYRNWLGHPLKERPDANKQLVRKFLHCYGPATRKELIQWLGCSPKQGSRLWDLLAEERVKVMADGRQAFMLAEDLTDLMKPCQPEREYLLLGGHDPYLDQRDRLTLLPDKRHHAKIWQLVSNPGAIVYHGEIIGSWTSRKQNQSITIQMQVWQTKADNEKLLELAAAYAKSKGIKLLNVDITKTPD